MSSSSHTHFLFPPVCSLYFHWKILSNRLCHIPVASHCSYGKTVRSCPTRPSVVCPLLPFPAPFLTVPALDLWPISTLAFPSYLECIMLVLLLCLCTWCSLRLAHLSLHVDLVMSFFLFSDFSLVITSSGRTFLDISD